MQSACLRVWRFDFHITWYSSNDIKFSATALDFSNYCHMQNKPIDLVCIQLAYFEFCITLYVGDID